MKASSIWILIAPLLLSFNSSADAAIIGPPVEEPDITTSVLSVGGYLSNGNLMEGIKFTTTLDIDGTLTTDFGYWTNGIGVTGTAYDWSVTMTDYDMSTQNPAFFWDFLNSSIYSITSLSIDALFGDTVFDIYPSSPDTLGSERGLPFHDNDSDTFVNITYSNLIQVGSAPAEGDLFGTLTIDFNTPLAPEDLYQFGIDTDYVSQPVPEPTTMLLLGIGIAGMTGLRIRRKK